MVDSFISVTLIITTKYFVGVFRVKVSISLILPVN